MTLKQSDETKIQELLLGRRIVRAEQGGFEYKTEFGGRDTASGRLTLDDGTEVFVTPNEGGCSCSAGDYELTKLAKVDNIITSVRLAVEDEVPASTGGEDPHSYRIYVVADAVEINAVQIDGDDGNGWYGTGYELFIVAPGGKS